MHDIVVAASKSKILAGLGMTKAEKADARWPKLRADCFLERDDLLQPFLFLLAA